MTALVPIRLECLPPCDCAEFVLNETPLPGAAGLRHLHCSACTHSWHMHASLDILETSPLYQYRRRGLAANRCNGFYPENRSTLVTHPWSTNTPCICGGPWRAHKSYHQQQHAQNEDVPSYPTQPTIPSAQHLADGSETPSLQNSHQSGQTSASSVASETHRNLLRANIPPPIAAFSGIKTSDSDRATVLRNASRLSSLPQNRKKKGNKPSSLNPDKTGNMNLVVFIYPLCGDDNFDDSPLGHQVLRLRADQLAPVYESAFKSRHLSFTTTLTSASPMRILYNGLKEAAERGNYVVPGLEKYKANHPRDNEVLRYENSFPYVIMSHRIREGRYTFEPTGRIGPGDTVTREILQKLCKDFNPLPLGPSNDFFLVVAPRFGHITSSLLGFTCHDEPPQVSEVHNCWPYRVLYEAGKPFYRFNRIQGNKPLAAWPNPVTCDDQCPQENTDMEMDSPSSPTRDIIEILDSPSPGGFSPPSLEVALLARRARTNSVPSSSPFPSSSPVLPSSPLLLPSPGPVQFPSPLSSPRLTSHSLAGSLYELSDEKLVLHWRKNIYSQVKMRFPSHGIEMEGVSVLRLAQITWAWFQHTINSPSEDFPMEEFGDITKFSPRSILFETQNLLQQHFRQYRIRGVLSRNSSVGPGLERAIILACLHHMVQNTDYWRRRADGTFTLYLSASGYEQPRREVYMEASGHLLAWSLLHLGQGFVVSHWVTLAVVAGIEAFSTLTYEEISAIEEADAKPLQSFLALTPDSTIVYDNSANGDNTIYQDLQRVFSVTLGADMVDLKHKRSQPEHRSLKGRVCAAMLLDSIVDWEHPDFLALKRGFDIQLHHLHANAKFLQITKDYPVLRLLRQLYLPFVDVEDLISHLSFELPTPENRSTPPDPDTLPDFQRALFYLFALRLKSYLRGKGHPSTSKGSLVDEDRFKSERDITTVRGSLALSALWGLPRPPADPQYTLKFICSFPLDGASHNLRLDFHTCQGYANVCLSLEIAELLSKEQEGEDHPSYLFFHGQFINACNDFNTL